MFYLLLNICTVYFAKWLVLPVFKEKYVTVQCKPLYKSLKQKSGEVSLHLSLLLKQNTPADNIKAQYIFLDNAFLYALMCTFIETCLYIFALWKYIV